MSQWHDPPTTLTSFGPLSSDVPEGNRLFSRLWKRTKNNSRSREVSTERSTDSEARISVNNDEPEEEVDKNLVSECPRPSDTRALTSKSDGPRTSVGTSRTLISISEGLRTSNNTARTLTGVLNRLSSIVQTGTPQTYKDSDFKQYWMPDESCRECYDCGDKFTTFRRRHHCRICGQIFCSKCCNQELQGRIIGYKGGIRVCTYCGKVAMSALQNEPSGKISVDKEDLQLSMESEPQVYSLWGTKKRMSQDIRFSSMITPSTPSIDVLIPFDLTQTTEEADMGLGRKFLEDSVQLREIWRQIVDPVRGVEMQSHRIRLKTYYKCIVGNKLVDWLLGNDKAAQRMQAVVIGQALLDAGYLEMIGGQQNIFQDNFTLYKPSETTPIDPPDNSVTGGGNSEPQWLQEIDVKTNHLDSLTTSADHGGNQEETTGSTFYVQLPAQEEKEFEPLPRQDSYASGYTEDIISVSMFGSSQNIPAAKLVKSVCWRNSDNLKEDNGEKKAYSLLKKAHQDHMMGLVQQMLYEEGLSKSWLEIVLGTAQRVSNYVRPDVREEGDDMNILKYVKFKKIPGETKEQTWLVHGVVFTRNIAHKQMAQKLVNPYVLLLKGSIEYQRVENKFSSLEPQILQEEEFLKKNVKKISSLNPKPNIVIVEKSVSRLAQNYLLEKGITLVYNVKLSVMEKIERLTQGCIVPSIDGIVSGPITLGFCHNFKVCHFTLPSGDVKTLLCFDGCAQHLGCTIVLRGGSKSELKKIKKVMKHMITACYNSQLEISYCMDEFAMPDSRADDTLSESDSVMTTTPQDKKSIKVSDYLQDNKSGINLMNLDPKTDNDTVQQGIMKEVLDQEEDNVENSKAVFQLEENETDSLLNVEHICQENTLTEDEVTVVDNRKDLNSASDSNKRSTVLTKKEEDLLKLKRQTLEIIPLNDQSDPLHIYQKNQDDAIFYSSVTLQEKTQKRCAKFKKVLNEVLLSSSPYIKFEVPYLDTKLGSSSVIRKFFPEDLYWSKYFESKAYPEQKKQALETVSPPKPASPWADIEITEPHPLILTQITGSLTDKHLQYLIADFRARGGRIQLKPRVTPEQHKPETNHQTTESKSTDCLDYSMHQKFTVLLSSHSEKSTNYPNPCVPPQLVSMPFYSGQDITLGGFLEKFCFREAYCCQPYMCPSENCEVPLLDHVRRIVHDHGSIFISLRMLSNCVPGGEKDIMMWNWCRKCRQATPLAAMSNDTWSLSFAKFLELRFYVNTFTRRMGPEPCGHSLHHSFSQYFGSKNIVATFKYMPVIKKEIVLPPGVIYIQRKVQLYQWTKLRNSMRNVEKKGLEMYNGVLEQLVTFNFSSEEMTKMITDMTSILENEKQRLKDLIHEGRLKVIQKEAENSESMVEFFVLYDESLKMMRILADADINWRSKMQELLSQQKKNRSSQAKKDRDSSADLLSKKEKVSSQISANSEDLNILIKKPIFIVGDSQSKKDNSTEPVLVNKDDVVTFSAIPESPNKRDLDISISPVIKNEPVNSQETSESTLMGSVSSRTSTELTRTWSGVLLDKTDFTRTESEPVNIQQSYFLAESGIYSVTPGLAAGIYDNKADIPDPRYVLLQTTTEGLPEDRIPKNTTPDPEQVNVKAENQSGEDKPSQEVELRNQLLNVESDPDKKLKSKKEVGKKTDDFTDSQQGERIGGLMRKTINFLSGTGLPPLPFPFDCREHHLLPTCYRVPVVVYDQEPSSIIAYAISSYDYHHRLQEIQSSFTTSQKLSKDMKTEEENPQSTDNLKKNTGSILSFVKNKENSPKFPRVDSVRYNPKVDTGNAEIDEHDGFSMLTSSLTESEKYKPGKQSLGPHIELQFSDHLAKFYCKIYFAEQFRKLRKLIFPAGEEMFIRSLSRCKMWDAKGGKSGSKFCKTDDQRFVLKQMSGAEIDVFEKFGPEYFSYINKCYVDQKPTALGKIVGVYRIGFRNTHTNTGIRQDLLVMENLFYERKISQTFDLKGSERNRLASTSGKGDVEQVLLDTNLLNLSIESPLYIYPHSKTLLMSVISLDSQFLSSNLVMDYSLLVGLDENRNELVLGIIDYIRTFTWDKKLETIIKSAGGKLPTVVSPEIYRSRFLSAMTRYFLPVPDQWTGKDFDPTLS